MADDDRRAEIEAAIEAAMPEMGNRFMWAASTGNHPDATAEGAVRTILEPLLDRVRDARGDDEVAAPMMIAAWVREQAEDKDYGTACEWRNVADAIEREAKDRGWRCECGDLNRDHEAFCYRCGAGPPEIAEEEDRHGDHD